MSKAKAERRELAIKKAKRNKILGLSAGAIVVIIFFAFVLYSVTRPEVEVRVYSAGPQSVTLYGDGRFSFVDCRSVRNGRFTETDDSGNVALEFLHNNRIVHGSISDDILTIPTEWDAGKGHSPYLRLE